VTESLYTNAYPLLWWTETRKPQLHIPKSVSQYPPHNRSQILQEVPRWTYDIWKGESQISHCPGCEGITRRRRMAPAILDLGTRWRWVVILHVLVILLQGKRAPPVPKNGKSKEPNSRVLSSGEERFCHVQFCTQSLYLLLFPLSMWLIWRYV
jgi:hypothetical protein